VDWEIAATLADATQMRALIGIALPSTVDMPTRLPRRLAMNIGTDAWPGYALMCKYPTSPAELGDSVDRALARRDLRQPSDSSFAPLMRRDRVTSQGWPTSVTADAYNRTQPS